MATITKLKPSLGAALFMVIASALALFAFSIDARSANITDKTLIAEANKVLMQEIRILQAQDRKAAAELNRSVAAIRNKAKSGHLTPSDIDNFFQRYPRLHANLERTIGTSVSQGPKCELLGGPIGRSKCKFICAFLLGQCDVIGIDCDECLDSPGSAFSITAPR